MTRPLTRKIGDWWRICYHGHPTPDHYTSAATANNAAAKIGRASCRERV